MDLFQLPPEIYDAIIGHTVEEYYLLKDCLVSKLWFNITLKHLTRYPFLFEIYSVAGHTFVDRMPNLRCLLLQYTKQEASSNLRTLLENKRSLRILEIQSVYDITDSDVCDLIISTEKGLTLPSLKLLIMNEFLPNLMATLMPDYWLTTRQAASDARLAGCNYTRIDIMSDVYIGVKGLMFMVKTSCWRGHLMENYEYEPVTLVSEYKNWVRLIGVYLDLEYERIMFRVIRQQYQDDDTDPLPGLSIKLGRNEQYLLDCECANNISWSSKKRPFFPWLSIEDSRQTKWPSKWQQQQQPISKTKKRGELPLYQPREGGNRHQSSRHQLRQCNYNVHRTKLNKNRK